MTLLDDKDLKASKETFQAIDYDNSGLISIDELKNAIRNLNYNLSD